MKYDPRRHHRRSIRLPGYDYTQPGAYFVTICTHYREMLFGDVINGVVRLTPLGEIVRDEWFKSAKIRQNVLLHEDEFVIMPNHIHGIIWIVDGGEDGGDVGADSRPPLLQPRRTPKSLGSIIAGFKSAATKRINVLRETPGRPVWQRNYYEHIIRTERALDAIRSYIQDNPVRWMLDRYHPNPDGTDPRAADLWQLLQADASTITLSKDGHLAAPTEPSAPTRPEPPYTTWSEWPEDLPPGSYDLSKGGLPSAPTEPPAEITARLLERQCEFQSILEHLHQLVGNGEEA